jgi:hypothetical protein
LAGFLPLKAKIMTKQYGFDRLTDMPTPINNQPNIQTTWFK